MRAITGKTTEWMRAIVGVWLVGILLLGCNHVSDRYHPDYSSYHHQIRRVLVLPPEIGIFEELSDGSVAWAMNKSRDAQGVAFEAVNEVLAAKDYLVESSGQDSRDNIDVHSVQSLFRSVNRSIQLHTYGPQFYPSKLKHFEYEVGPVRGILEAYGADALVLVVGHQTLSQLRPKTWLSIAVVEPGGKIIWYGMQGAKQSIDLQTPDSAFILVHETLQPFIGVGS